MLTATDPAKGQRRKARNQGPKSVHLFCGIGGDTEGFYEAGFDPVAAANHSRRNIETHAANFPDTEHLCVDINHYDMRNLPPAQVLAASPICTEGSPAGGRKRHNPPTRGQMELLEFGPVATDQWERTRATAYDVIRATEIWAYDAVMCENVIEFATDWPLFDWWLDGFEKLGYNHTIACVSSAHIGDETNPHAPQWRDRLYIVFTKKSLRRPDLAPRPLALCVECSETVQAVQWWKDPRKPKIGKYRQQYVYRCPNSQCRHAIVEPFVRPAASIIDWSNLGTRIGDRKRPLAQATMRRILKGIEMFGRPALVNSAHDDDRAYPADGSPFPTRTVKIGDGVACPPFLDANGGNWNTAPASILDPFRTRTTTEWEALFAPPGAFIDVQRNNGRPHSPQEPLTTIAAGGNHHALVIPYRKGSLPYTSDRPFQTMSTVDSAALLAPAIDIQDCHYRMVQPREQASSQRFPGDYEITGNLGEQTAGTGNAVSVNVAHWIGRQVRAVLNGGSS